MRAIGQLIREQGMSQAEVSRRTGIHTSTISRLVAGKAYAYPGWRRRICLVLGVEEDELFAKDGFPRASERGER